MKQIFIILLILGIHFSSYSQPDIDGVRSIKMYSVEWKLMTKFPYTIDNFKKYYKYYFETKKHDLEVMFMDYNDCVGKLSSQKELILPDSISGETKKINALIELTFDKEKTVSLFFDSRGNYYFQNKWHVKNDGLYYLLFKYFSDVIIHQAVIEDAEKNYKDKLWHGN
jgi:hypothetical protein